MLLTACSTQPAQTLASSSPATVAVLPEPVQPLAPGRYSKPDFKPAITFTVGDGWQAVQAVPGFFDVEQEPGSPDVVAAQFGKVLGGNTAAQVADTIAARNHLVVIKREVVTVDGRDAIRLVVDTDDPADTAPPLFRPVLDLPPGALSIASGRRLQVTLIDANGGVLGILVGGSIRQWSAALAAANPVLDSVTIGR